jgi:L-asparaginase
MEILFFSIILMFQRSEHPEEIEPIAHFSTGGTIDSQWDPSSDTAVPMVESFIPEYLEDVARIQHSVTHKRLFMKDSRETSFNDQDNAANAVASTTFKRVLMTCGTFLMDAFARGVCNHEQSPFYDRFDKKVAITGSLIPNTGYLESDAGFNLGMAISFLQQDYGKRVGVIMNGAVFDAANVRKDLTIAAFGSSGNGPQLTKVQDFTLIPAGGTIDFRLDGVDGLVPKRESGVSNYLRNRVQMLHPPTTTPPILKDSRNLSESDMNTIADMIRLSTHEHILITLGVYGLTRMQKFLRKNTGPALKEKKVVLTGSRLPLSLSDDTDAPFQLGYAMGTVGFLEPGAHIAMNGRVFTRADNFLDTVYTPGEALKIKEKELHNKPIS